MQCQIKIFFLYNLIKIIVTWYRLIFLSSIAIIIAVGNHLEGNEGNEEASSLRDE